MVSTPPNVDDEKQERRERERAQESQRRDDSSCRVSFAMNRPGFMGRCWPGKFSRGVVVVTGCTIGDGIDRWMLVVARRRLHKSLKFVLAFGKEAFETSTSTVCQ